MAETLSKARISKSLHLSPQAVGTSTGLLPSVVRRSSPHVALWRAIEATAPSFGVRLTPADVQGPAEIERAIEALAREPNGGLIVLSGPITNTHRELIAAFAVRHRLPTAYGF